MRPFTHVIWLKCSSQYFLRLFSHVMCFSPTLLNLVLSKNIYIDLFQVHHQKSQDRFTLIVREVQQFFRLEQICIWQLRLVGTAHCGTYGGKTTQLYKMTPVDIIEFLIMVYWNHTPVYIELR